MDELYYISAAPNINEIITVDDDNFHHITRVMRKNTGDNLHLTNGEGQYFSCEIQSVTKKNLTAKVTSIQSVNPPLKRSIYFYCGNLKNRDRLEWLVEKCGELGISSLTPILTDHSVKQSNNSERLRKIALSALKQSKNAYLLQVKQTQSIAASFDEISPSDAVYFLHEKKLEQSLLLAAIPEKMSDSIRIFIGPEGGFSAEEVDMFLSKGFVPVWLGEQRFRTETAAMVAASFLNQEFISHG